MSELPALPPSYSWGERKGDYRIINRGDREICRVGGVIEKTCGLSRAEVYRSIMRGEWEAHQVDCLMGNFPAPLPDEIQRGVSAILAATSK